MPDRYVRMRFMSSGDDKVKSTLDDLTERARKFGMERADLKIGANDDEFTRKQKEVRAKFDVLKHESAKLNVGIDDDKFVVAAKEIRLRMSELGAMLARPKVELEGYEKASLEMDKLKLKADALAGTYKIDARTVNSKSGFVTLGSAEREAMKLEKGASSRRGGSGFFGRLFGGRNGGVSGNTGPVQGLLSGGPGQAIASIGPTGLGVLGTYVASLLPGLVGAGIGGGVAGTGFAGSVVASKYYMKQLKSDATQVKADQKNLLLPGQNTAGNRAGLKADTNIFNRDTKAAAPFVNMTAQMKAILPDLVKPLSGFAKGLGPIINQFDGFLKLIGPTMAKMFKASLPFVKAFMTFMEQAGKSLIPAFTQAMNQMVKSGALKIMTQGMIILIKSGLVPMIKAMGPGMKDSAEIFSASMEVIAVLLHGLGIFATLAAKGIVAAAHSINERFIKPLSMGISYVRKNWRKDLNHIVMDLENWRHDIAKTFDGIRHSISAIWEAGWKDVRKTAIRFGHDVEGVFDAVKHTILRIVDNITSYVSAVWRQFWRSTVGKWFKDGFDKITHFADKLRHDLASIFDAVTHYIGNKVKASVNYIQGLWDGLSKFASHIFGTIRHDVEAIWDAFWHWIGSRTDQGTSTQTNKFKSLWHDLTHIFDTIRHDISKTWDAMFQWLGKRADSFVNALRSTMHKIEGFFMTPIKWVIDGPVSKLVNVYDSVNKAIGKPLPNIPIPHFDGGGWVPMTGGNLSDNKPAYLTPGERVLSRNEVSMLGGPSVLDSILPPRGSGQHLANGGWWSDVTGFLGNLGSKALSGLANTIPGGKTLLKDIAQNAAGPAAKVAESVINSTLRGGGLKGLVRHGADDLVTAALKSITSAVAASNVTSGSGAAVAKYAEKHRGHRYVLGGSGDYQTKHSDPFGPWDCAGFVGQMYHHFGINAPFPGINVDSLRHWAKFTKKPEVGGMAFWVTDGTKAHPGHVGLVTGKNKSIQAMDPALGTRDSDLAGAIDFAVPPHGWGTATAVGNVGAGYVNIGKALMREGFGRAAAAGIVGCIAKESGGHPDSIEGNEFHHGAVRGAGTPSGPNGGLIGWTHTWAGPGPMITGNVGRDMSAQVAGIKTYVNANGSMGDMNRYKDPLQASIHFSARYERPLHALSDVDAGVARGTFAKLDTGNGWLMPGLNMIYNGLGRMEHLVDPDRYKGHYSGGGAQQIVMIPTQACTGCDACTRKTVQSIKQYKRHNGNSKLGID